MRRAWWQGVLLACAVGWRASPVLGGAAGGAAWTQIPVLARPAALGRLLVVGGRAWEGPFTNLAALRSAQAPVLAVGRVYWIQGVRGQHVVFVQPGSRVALGLWAGLIEVPGIERRTTKDELIGEFTAHHLRAGAAAAAVLPGDLTVGIGLQWLYQKIDVYEAGAVSLDLGIRKRGLPGGFAVGLSLRDLPLTESLGQGGVRLRTSVAAGVARALTWRGRSEAVLLEADVSYGEGGRRQAAVAAELRPLRALDLRFGYFGGSDLQDLSFGVGLRVTRFRFDYAYLPFREDFGDVHSFGFVVRL